MTWLQISIFCLILYLTNESPFFLRSEFTGNIEYSLQFLSTLMVANGCRRHDDHPSDTSYERLSLAEELDSHLSTLSGRIAFLHSLHAEMLCLLLHTLSFPYPFFPLGRHRLPLVSTIIRCVQHFLSSHVHVLSDGLVDCRDARVGFWSSG